MGAHSEPEPGVLDAARLRVQSQEMVKPNTGQVPAESCLHNGRAVSPVVEYSEGGAGQACLDRLQAHGINDGLLDATGVSEACHASGVATPFHLQRTQGT